MPRNSVELREYIKDSENNKLRHNRICIVWGDFLMPKTTKTDQITTHSNFKSKTPEEITLNMSNIITKLINRELESKR